MTWHFSLIWVGGTIGKPTPVDDQPDDKYADTPAGVPLVNGWVYFLARDRGETRKIEIVRRANLRAAESLKSPVAGVVKPGEVVRPAYWCFGSEVDEESGWWILMPEGGKDPIKHDPRLWVAATNSRPG